MKVAESIKTAREALGMTQEDLAEKLEVSRQAVSKWELGASVPSPEKLETLAEVLDIVFPTGEEGTTRGSVKPLFWKTAAITLGVLMLAALCSIVLYLTIKWDKGEDESVEVTGVYWFTGEGTPLHPDLGDGWCLFEPDTQVLLVVSFQDFLEKEVHAVSVYLTPTGTETFDQREQLAVQSGNDRKFALFAFDIPQGLMGHLEIMLECSGQTVIEMLNVTSIS